MAKRILLVDDSPILQVAASEALAGAGYEVAVRGTFEEMIEKGVSGYDLILLDVQMPELFGDDVASVLRHERGVTTPIYLFSSLSPAALEDLVRVAKVDGYIAKDEGIAALVARVRSILGDRGG